MRLSHTLVALPLLFACGSGDPPVIHSVTVNPTEVAPGEETTLTVDIANFELRPPSDHGADHSGLQPAEEEHMHGEGEHGDYPDGGHYHVYLDSVESNPLMINCPDHCKHPAFAASVRVKIPDDASPGMHDVIVRLNMDDHKFLDPPIQHKATLTVTSTSS